MTPTAKKILKTLFPLIASLSAYFLVRKFFPENLSSNDLSNQIDPKNDLRGGDIVKLNRFKTLLKILNKNKALKVGIITLFVTAGASCFEDEIQNLLSADVLSAISHKTVKEQLEVDGKLQVVCDIIKDNNLDLHVKSVRELIISKGISYDDKVKLLKIKLDYILNVEYSGRKRFLLLFLLALILTVFISGIADLSIFMEALYQLFKEGKISKALYEEILRLLKKKIILDLPDEIESF